MHAQLWYSRRSKLNNGGRSVANHFNIGLGFLLKISLVNLKIYLKPLTVWTLMFLASSDFFLAKSPCSYISAIQQVEYRQNSLEPQPNSSGFLAIGLFEGFSPNSLWKIVWKQNFHLLCKPWCKIYSDQEMSKWNQASLTPLQCLWDQSQSTHRLVTTFTMAPFLLPLLPFSASALSAKYSLKANNTHKFHKRPL